MIIAISATGENPDAPMEERFGRAPGFLLHDTETGEYTYMDNAANAGLPQAAGIQTAQNLAARGVKAVITGQVGPKAAQALNAGSIPVHNCSGCSVSEAVARFKNNQLQVSAGDPAMGYGAAPATPGGQGCRRLGGSGMGMGMGRGGGRGGGRGMGGRGTGMGGRGMGGGGMGRNRGS